MASCGERRANPSGRSRRIEPASRRLEAEEDARKLRAAGADQSRQADDLAAPDGEADVVNAGVARRHALELRARGSPIAISRFGKIGVDFAADHQADELGLGRRPPCPRVPTV